MFATLKREGAAVCLQGSLLHLIIEEADGGGAAEGHHVIGEVVMCGLEVEAESGLFQPLLVHEGRVVDQIPFWRLRKREREKQEKL